MDTSLLREFQMGWRLAGKAHRTASEYVTTVLALLQQCPEPSLADVKQWIASTSSTPTQRKRGQAVRAIGKWAELQQYDEFTWWRQVPLIQDSAKPQATATESDYLHALSIARTHRDTALIEVLWSTGLRRSEIERLNGTDVNLADSFLLVRIVKCNTASLATHGNSICSCLEKGLGCASPSCRGFGSHCKGRAAGWSSGAIVSRYTMALTGELAIEEFHKRWN
jgi:hypothetical protein